MKIILNKNKLEKLIHNEKNLGFVPTMGAIHKGHVSLVKKSKSQCSKTIVSIFINKPQFNKKKDFKKYPRILNQDILKIRKLNVDYLYLPKTKQIYPKGQNRKIKISSFKKKLCGKFRPGHFEAVVDVVERFIKIIRPKKIYLGEKDMQQLKIIDLFVKKKYKHINIVPCKTIRERNGIACSSRNYILTSKEKKIASKVYKFLKKKKTIIIKNKVKLKFIKNKLYNFGISKIEYLEKLDINKISKPKINKSKYRIFLAYYLGNTRLIDNF